MSAAQVAASAALFASIACATGRLITSGGKS
jgi:hypothetical protein